MLKKFKKTLEKIKEFLNTKNGRIAAAAVGVALLLLLLAKAAAPKSVNIFINNAKDCQNSMKAAKKTEKYKNTRKDK